MKIDRNLYNNAEYIIKFFSLEGKQVTNLKLQKLLYFLEAIYMINTKENKLFDEEFTAWDFGPVNKELYDKYKINGRESLPVNENISINPINEEYIKVLFRLFGSFSAFQLVAVSHGPGSPWDEINKKYNGEIDRNVVIDKLQTKEWFDGIVEKNDK